MKRTTPHRTAIIASAVGLALALPTAAFAVSSTDKAGLDGKLTLDSSSNWYASGQFVLENGSEAAQDWKLTFTVPEGTFQNSSSWNIDASVVGEQVTLSPKNGAIPAGQSEYISFGIAGEGSGALQLAGCSLNGANVAGCSSAGEEEEDSEKPSTPENLTADTVDSSTIHVMWEHATDNVAVAGYRIFQDGVQVKELPKSMRMANISGLAADTAYEYSVEAFDAAGNASERSATVVGKTAAAPVDDTEAPSAVENVTATATGPRTVDLRWNAATDNVGVTSYTIVDDQGRRTKVEGNESSATISGLSPETNYTFKVHAEDAAGLTGPEASVSVTTPEDIIVEPGKGTPTNFTAAPGSYQDGNTTMYRMQLAWTPAEATKRYEIYIDGEYAQTLLIGSAQASDQKRNVLLGTERGTHTVKLRAQLADGSWSAFTPELTIAH